MANYYCETCGQKYSNIASLTSGNCKNHPNGPLKGKHKLYEGTEKSQYICKLCGTKNSSIAGLTSGNCKNHPNGTLKGKHQPAN
ncbi:MAG TPA: hypothetical protein P5343_00065 [Flavobacteriaceae bacterium]|nr:hypothetical protein [Bacteroidota bacterium]HRW43159.1 hypothetical protein [Flavobacteriaceae bacterium]